MTSEMAITESLLLQKWGTLAQKKGHFFHFLKKIGGAHTTIAPRFRGPQV
jgi:hypothetical protein